MDAASRASVFSLGEEEADIRKDNRMHGGERAKSGGRSARASEFAQRLIRVRRPDQDGRPSLADREPALEQLAECTVACLRSTSKPRTEPCRGSAPSLRSSPPPSASSSTSTDDQRSAASAANEAAHSLAPGAPLLPMTASTVPRPSSSEGAAGNARPHRKRSSVGLLGGRTAERRQERLL